MGRALSKALVCGIAGALAWLLCEPFYPKQVNQAGVLMDDRWAQVESVAVLILGALIGLAAGLFNGMERGGKRNIGFSIAIGVLFGTIGSSFGHLIAGGFFVSLAHVNTIVARTVAFTPWGLALGAGVGASQRSKRGMMSGALGGAIAGFVTGAMFDQVSLALSGLTTIGGNPGIHEIGAPGRAIMDTGLGLLVGLFTALVDLATRRAWLRLVLGRNEGKEWPIDNLQTLIGRDERAHVPLFGDPSIPALAAVIVKQGRQYILQDPGSPIGIGHNGVRVPQAILSSGDTIQIGSLNFQFMMRAGGASQGEGRAKAIPVGGAPMQAGAQAPAPQPFVPQQAPMPGTYAPPANQTAAYQAPTGANQTMAYPGQAPVANQTMAYQPPVVQQPVAAPMTGSALVVMTGPMTGQRIPVGGPIDIGRESPGVTLSYDAQASRRHANVAPGPGGLQVTDLGSTNGTYVNGQRIQSATVRQGDVVTVGSTQFRVE